MSAFLKLIGSAENPCPEPYRKSYVDFSRNPRQVQTGDHLVLYAAGGRKRIFALAEVVSGVYDAGSDFDGRWPYRVDVRYLVNVSATEGVHINEVSTPARDLLRSVGRQSYIRLVMRNTRRPPPSCKRWQALTGRHDDWEEFVRYGYIIEPEAKEDVAKGES